MRDRDVLRAQVTDSAAYSERLATIFHMATNFEWLNPYEEFHLQRIDGRLNQSCLVGASVRYIGDGHKDYAMGDTLINGFLALIPRAIWWNKNVNAGSGTLVSDYTGIPYNNETTSVGIGHVMELYINFGTVGVVIGFFFHRAGFNLD